MEIFIIISILLVIVSIILLIKYNKTQNILKNHLNDYLNSEKTKLKSLYEVEEQKLIEKKKSVEEVIKALEAQYQQALKSQTQLMDKDLKAYWDKANQQYSNGLNKSISILKEEAFNAYGEKLDYYTESLNESFVDLERVKQEVADWQARRDAINEDIRRAKLLREQTDFYKVCLTPEAISDIKVLKDARSKLHSYESLDKLIYDGYVSKQVNEMIKRVLEGDAPSGIYKITRLSTGEIYIGKSTDVKRRWQEHCKSCFNVGTIANSILHTTMKQDGIENFTFELIEKCPKDQLTEREKFYINLYDSKNYGLNEKVG